MKDDGAVLESPRPAEIYPARKRLAKCFANYRKAAEEIEEYKGRAARAELDESKALESQTLSEEEAAKRISQAQALKSVYAARTASREQSLTALFAELRTALASAMSELSIALDILRESRLETLKNRVLEAISADPELKEGREFLFVFELRSASPISERWKSLTTGSYGQRRSPQSIIAIGF